MFDRRNICTTARTGVGIYKPAGQKAMHTRRLQHSRACQHISIGASFAGLGIMMASDIHRPINTAAEAT
jgi:hypothetical protein